MGRSSSFAWLLLALLGAAGLGCHHGDAFRLTEQRMQNLLRQASAATQCPAAAMTSERISDRVFRVSGCGTYVDFAAFARGHGRYSGGRWVRVMSIAERASIDLACPAASSTFTAVGPVEYVVSGCGQRGTFDLRCGTVDCAWIAASITGAPTASAPVMASTQVVIPSPPVVDPSGSVQAALGAVRATVLSCSGGQPLTAQLSWDGAGHMMLALAPPFGGTAVETCVAGIVGSAQITGLTVPGSAAVTFQ